MLTLRANVKLIGCVILALGVGYTQAAGFGIVQVQSWLGEPLNLNVSVIGTDANPQWFSCIKARIESLDGAVVFVPKIDLRITSQRQSIQLTTHQSINEPVMNVVLKLGCEISVSRTYQILLDPIAFLPNVDAVAQSALSSAAIAEKVQITVPGKSIDNISASKVKMRRPSEKKTRFDRNKNIRVEARAPSAQNEKKASSNRLRLTLLDEPSKTIASQKSLPAPLKEIPPTKVLTTKSEPVSTESSLSAGDLSNATQMAMIKSLQIEIDTLRNENNRIKQKGTSDVAAMQSVRSELFSWLAGLGLILVMCLGAILWLTSRFIALKKMQNQSSWNSITETPIYPRRRHEANEDENENTSKVIDGALHRARKENIQVEVKPILSDPNTDSNQKQEDVERLRQLYQQHTVMSAREAAIEKIPLEANDAANETANVKPVWAEDTPGKVEEISDVMELVGAWMALHKPTEVLKLLEPFNHVATPDSPLPWLCLLDVYNSMNDQEKYEAIGKRLVALFNVKVVPWEARTAIGRANLANFPHIVNKVLALWDSDEVAPYLASLLVNDRAETRVGFDLAIYRDIERLHVLAKDPSRPRDIDKLRNYKAGAILFAPPPGLEGADDDEKFLSPQVEPDTERLTKNKYPSKLPKRAKYVSDYHYGGHYDGFSGDGLLNTITEVNPTKASVPGELSFDEPAISIPLDSPKKMMSGDKSSEFLMNEIEVQNELVANDKDITEETEDNSPNAFISPIIIKLKLAIAYQDIGDSEGAILLLEEVINEGSEEEAEQARMMLALMSDTVKPTTQVSR